MTRSLVGILVAAAVLLAGCGSSSLSKSQLQVRARRICGVAQARTNRIPTPMLPSEGTAFLSRGVAALTPELAQLRRLRVSGTEAGDYRRALDASDRELAMLRSTIKGLKAGNDPLVAIKTLQQELLPLERTAQLAWQALGVPACSES